MIQAGVSARSDGSADWLIGLTRKEERERERESESDSETVENSFGETSAASLTGEYARKRPFLRFDHRRWNND